MASSRGSRWGSAGSRWAWRGLLGAAQGQPAHGRRYQGAPNGGLWAVVNAKWGGGCLAALAVFWWPTMRAFSRQSSNGLDAWARNVSATADRTALTAQRRAHGRCAKFFSSNDPQLAPRAGCWASHPAPRCTRRNPCALRQAAGRVTVAARRRPENRSLTESCTR